MSCCPINRVWCDSWSWCLALTPPITSARPPNRSWQLSRSHSSSWTYQSPRGRVTATWAPIVTCRCIFFLQDLNVLRLPCLSCLFFFFFILPFTLWPDHKPSKKGRRVEVGPKRSCSGKQQDELWFNPQRRGLYLCDGTAWIAVLQGEDANSYLLPMSLSLGSESNKPLAYPTC